MPKSSVSPATTEPFKKKGWTTMSVVIAHSTQPMNALLRNAAVISMLLIAAACSQPAQQTPTEVVLERPAQALSLPQATLGDGFVIDLELDITPEEVANGLMFRPSLAANRGMLFIFEVERLPSFWMKNTLIPLDLIFLDSTGMVVDVVPNVQPCAADPCPNYSSTEPSRAVLELAAGSAETHGLEKGSLIAFDRTPGFPVAVETEPEENE